MEQKREYQICTRCIMNTSDLDIVFGEKGECNYCHEYESLARGLICLKKRESGALNEVVADIKKKGKNKKYDCVIGVSGGVDSTYVAYLVKKMGLRPLAVHLDNGWDSELAVDNIKRFLDKLQIDLHTFVLDWEEFKALQLAFLQASTPDSEIPTDHAIAAVLYKTAGDFNIKFVISGANFATEGGGPVSWSQGHSDWGYIKGIYEQFAKKRLKKFPHIGLFEFINYKVFKGIRLVPILDYIDYNKKEAMAIIGKELGWRDYGGKHYESVYTRFYQGYILPKKFGFDKKRHHLSTLIWSGQMSRAEAVEKFGQTDYPEALQQQDKKFVIKKLGIADRDFDDIMAAPLKSFWDYKSYKRIVYRYKFLIKIYHHFKKR